jgi:hypothetical protein
VVRPDRGDTCGGHVNGPACCRYRMQVGPGCSGGWPTGSSPVPGSCCWVAVTSGSLPVGRSAGPRSPARPIIPAARSAGRLSPAPTLE